MGSALWIATADVSSDGKPDLVAATGCCVGGGVVGVLRNNAPSDNTAPVISIFAVPKTLLPPNGKLVPVKVVGIITDIGSGIQAGSAEYSVRDEYHLVQPQGKISLDNAGNYSFTVLLRASREGDDPNGRRYTIRVTAKDNANNRGVNTRVITVPHDRLN